jgi:hypothetical protein
MSSDQSESLQTVAFSTSHDTFTKLTAEMSVGNTVTAHDFLIVEFVHSLSRLLTVYRQEATNRIESLQLRSITLSLIFSRLLPNAREKLQTTRRSNSITGPAKQRVHASHPSSKR